MQEAMTAAEAVRGAMMEAARAVTRAARNIAKEYAAAGRAAMPVVKARPSRKAA
jgi:hypothetical protein